MPEFTTPKQLVDWYDNQERILTPDFLDTISWGEVSQTEVDPALVPVLLYFRDVEKLTEIYYKELRKTPTGRDPEVRQFMDKWQHEEDLHGELLNRFLEEAGFPSGDAWFEKMKHTIPRSYRYSSALGSLTANLFGKRFSAVHMTWGAINEMMTLTGYRQLWKRANHPVLTYILKAIVREESVHAFFYATFAKLQLQRSRYTQHIATYILKHFWSPVGQGAKPVKETAYVMDMLFDGAEGVSVMDTFVNKRLELFPGFEKETFVTDTISRMVRSTRTQQVATGG